MKKTIFLFLLLQVFRVGLAQEPKVYVATLNTGFGHTGMAMPVSALFFQPVTAVDTSWQFLGRPNNRIFNVDFYRSGSPMHIALATHTGVQQSQDAGITWKVTTDWRVTEVLNVAIDPKNPDVLYCCSPYGFYKTEDGGKKWRQLIAGLKSIDARYVSTIVIDHGNSKRLFIATEDGIYRSEDAGNSWTRTGLNVRNSRVVAQHPTDANTLVAGTENNGLYFSYDGGQIWEKRDTGVGHDTFYAITFDGNNPDIIYAGGYQTGVYRSIDAGLKWTRSHQGLVNLDIQALAVTPGNSDRVYAGTVGGGVYLSQDRGYSWRYFGIHNGYITAIKIF